MLCLLILVDDEDACEDVLEADCDDDVDDLPVDSDVALTQKLLKPNTQSQDTWN